jgi:hypothetical protein
LAQGLLPGTVITLRQLLAGGKRQGLLQQMDNGLSIGMWRMQGRARALRKHGGEHACARPQALSLRCSSAVRGARATGMKPYIHTRIHTMAHRELKTHGRGGEKVRVAMR